MWDWGTQPFNSVIVTFVFSVYLTSQAFGDTNATSSALSLSTTIAGVLVALVAPVLGQSADRTGHVVRNLRWQTWGLAALSGLLFFIKPEPHYLWVGLVLLAAGTVINEIAQVNYYATIAQVATRHNIGRVSGFGWGLGYLGGIVVLLLLYFLFIQPEVGLFGVTGTDGLDIRVSMLVCALWMLVFTIPTFWSLRDPAVAHPVPRRGAVGAYRDLGRSVRRLWREDRQTAYFLLSSALFRDGLVGVFAFGGVLAAGTFGFTGGEVIVFGAAANVVAGVATMAFGLVDDRIGPKRVIVGSLACLVVLGVGLFVFHDAGKGAFWALALAMCVFVGPAQSASRSFLARIIPEGRAGEVFGLYATTGRAISWLSPALFGLAIWLGASVTGAQNTQYWGILGIVVVLAAGLVVVVPLREPARPSAAG